MHNRCPKPDRSMLCALAILAVLMFPAHIHAQGYSRKSLTTLMLRFSNDRPVSESYFNQLYIPSRFDYNNIGTKSLPVGDYFNNSHNYGASDLKELMYENRIPNKVLRSILIDESRQAMTVSVVQNRGLYNATDAEYVMANNSARGIDVLKDAGINLLENIYILVVQPTSYKVERNETTTANIHTLGGVTFLFQLNLDSAYMSKTFWDEFYFEKANSSMMNKFMNHRFPLKTSSWNFTVTVSDLDGANTFSAGLQAFTNSLNSNNNSTPKPIDQSQLRRKSSHEIRNQLMEKINNSALSRITSWDDFAIRSSVFSKRPLLSKIGKKEGVRVDDLFKVSEKVLDPKTGKMKSRHIGYVRAKRVADNRYRNNGISRPSSFYRISSRRISKGMELTEHDETDYMFGLMYNLDSTNIMGGYFMNVEYITHLIPGFNLAVDLGYNPRLVSKEVYDVYDPVPGYFVSDAVTAAFSLRQSFSYHRLSVTAVGGALMNYQVLKDGTVMGRDYETINSSKISSEYSYVGGFSFGYLYGADIGFNITRTIQLRGGYRFTGNTDPLMKPKDATKSFPYYMKYNNSTISVGLRLARLN